MRKKRSGTDVRGKGCGPYGREGKRDVGRV